jgi:hypothetical protein
MRQLQQALTARRQARGHQQHGDIGDDGDGSVWLMVKERRPRGELLLLSCCNNMTAAASAIMFCGCLYAARNKKNSKR